MRNPISRLFLAAAALMLSQHAQSLENLPALYLEARGSNPAFLAANARTNAEKQNETIARGQLLPNLSVSGSYGRNDTQRNIGNLPAEKFNYDNYAYNLNLRQPLFRKYNLASYAQAKAQSVAADARLSQAEKELIIRLVSAYMDVLFSDDQIRLLEAQKASLAGQLAAAEMAIQAGTGTRIDVDEARARHDILLAQEIEARNLRQHNRRVLDAIINRESGALAALKTENFQPPPPFPSDIQAWLALAEANNPEYQGLLAQGKAAGLEVEKALAGHYPSVDLVASIGRSGNDNLSSLNRFGNTDYKTVGYGLQLNIPLFSGGQVNAAVYQARERQEEISQQTEETKRNINVQTRREFDNLILGAAKIQALERAEISGRRTIQSARKGVEAGVRSTLDVLQVEQQYYLVLRDLAQARYSHLISWVKLKALAGTLSLSDLETLSALFSP